MRRNPGALCALALLLTAASPGETQRWYVVREGDTLTRVATRHGVTVDAIASSNRMDPGGILRIGQRLLIPSSGGAPPSPGLSPPPTQPLSRELSRPEPAPAPAPPPALPRVAPAAPPEGPETIVIEQGDTLYGLSRRHGVPLADLMTWNGLGAKSVLRVGQRLKIRRSGSSAPASPAPAAPPPAPVVAPPTPKPAEPRPEPKPEVRPAAPVEPRPDAEPKPAVATPEPKAKEEPKPAERARAPSISTKNAPSRFRLFGRPKPSGSFVHLQDVRQQIDQPRIKRDRWKYIVIHHSGTSKGSGEVFEHYHRVVRGMENGLAYQFVIGNGSYTGDGQIEVGDRWLKQKAGGHLYSEFLNEIAIGICFVGNFNAEKPTARQIAACIELVDYLRQICPGTRPKFVLHREINPRPTECPGRLFPGDALRKRLK